MWKLTESKGWIARRTMDVPSELTDSGRDTWGKKVTGGRKRTTIYLNNTTIGPVQQRAMYKHNDAYGRKLLLPCSGSHLRFGMDFPNWPMDAKRSVLPTVAFALMMENVFVDRSLHMECKFYHSKAISRDKAWTIYLKSRLKVSMR
ncbi:hypothetical protein KM043_018362 [Ampulex compressa]|nr:hypothetical protein KM043_018362 [Ampulex compressa]